MRVVLRFRRCLFWDGLIGVGGRSVPTEDASSSSSTANRGVREGTGCAWPEGLNEAPASIFRILIGRQPESMVLIHKDYASACYTSAEQERDVDKKGYDGGSCSTYAPTVLKGTKDRPTELSLVLVLARPTSIRLKRVIRTYHSPSPQGSGTSWTTTRRDGRIRIALFYTEHMRRVRIARDRRS